VHRAKLVEELGRDGAKHGKRAAGKRQLPPDHDDQCETDEQEAEAGDGVLEPDHPMIGREQDIAAQLL